MPMTCKTAVETGVAVTAIMGIPAAVSTPASRGEEDLVESTPINAVKSAKAHHNMPGIISFVFILVLSSSPGAWPS